MSICEFLPGAKQSYSSLFTRVIGPYVLTELSFVISQELSVFMYLKYGDCAEFRTRGVDQICKSA